MMINNNIQSLIKAYADTKPASTKKTESTAGVYAKDEVVLSSQAQNFRAVLQKAKTASEVRPEKVEAISQQISQGTYAVDSRLIAEKMLNSRW